MDYIMIGLIILVLLFLFNTIGKIINLRFNLPFIFNIPIGYVFSLAIGQVVGVIAIIFGISTDHFILMYVGTFILSLILLGYKGIKNHINFSQFLLLDNRYNLKSKQQWISMGCIVLGAFFIYINIMQQYRIDRMSDSAFYIPHILENVNATQVYSINPWSGVSEPFNNLYLYVTYELFHSMIIRIFRVSGLVYINHGMTFINFIVIMMSVVELSMKLFKSKKSILSVLFWLFVTFVFIKNISDNYFFFFSTDMIERLPYSGKVLAYLAFVPMFYTFLIDFFKSQQSKKVMTGILTLLNLAMMALTSTGVFLFGIVYAGILFFKLWSRKKNYEEVLLLSLSTWPLLVFVILAKYSNLTFPIIISYFILWILYKRNIQFIYGIMKIGVLLISLLIPIGSLALQILTSNLDVALFTASDFIIRLEESTNFDIVMIWIISLFSIACYLRNKNQNEANKLLFGKVPLYLLIVFINPISCAFVATFMTSISVYHRLFYAFPLFPLLSMFINSVLNYVQKIRPKQVIISIMISGFGGILLYHSYTGVNSVIVNRLLNSNFSYKNMVDYKHNDNAEMLKEFVPTGAKVAMSFRDNLWADELRSLRSLAPHVILPYNTYTHRRLVENGEYTKDEYYTYQLMLVLNGTISSDDYFINEFGEVTELENGEVLLEYLIKNYDYVVVPRDCYNKSFLYSILRQGKKIIARTYRDYLIEL